MTGLDADGIGPLTGWNVDGNHCGGGCAGYWTE